MMNFNWLPFNPPPLVALPGPSESESTHGWPLATGLPSVVHNGLLVSPKDYEAPPPSHIATFSRSGGVSG
jgi:hypothetical protein